MIMESTSSVRRIGKAMCCPNRDHLLAVGQLRNATHIPAVRYSTARVVRPAEVKESRKERLECLVTLPPPRKNVEPPKPPVSA